MELIYLALFCLGWNTAIQEGMLFGAVGAWFNSLHREANEYIYKNEPVPKRLKNKLWLIKPLGDCIACSASVVGFVGWLLLNVIPYGYVVVTLIALIAVNPIIYNLTDWLFAMLSGQNAKNWGQNMSNQEKSKQLYGNGNN